MAVIFIEMLLLVAGVEPNPGPSGQILTFRYQYLLIEIGTSILRKLFDYQVGPDFKQYLDNHTAAKGHLKFLITSKKITAQQQKLILPVNKSPSSSNFDITLLCCLLRNACGLRAYSDAVWINPLPKDISIEAQITRLKECRNNLMHSGRVFDSETDLEAKWVKLCSLQCGFIDQASFVPGCQCNCTFLLDYGSMVDVIGAVTFIGMLLLMAGVEPHPGPTDVLSFRYQYLLIEVGTSILRKVFDHQVGPGDFKQYLDNNFVAKKQLQFLINTNTISAEQQQFIPPIDNCPSSSNFDITLLCCLLRNACGLRVYSDTVWMNPSPNDTTIEALVYRLKECRNKLMHSGSVFDSETDLNAKWMELCSILTGLGNFCGMTNLQPLLDKAKTVVIDEKMKEQFDNMMSAWMAMDRLFDHRLGEVVSKVDQCVEGQERLEQKVDQCVEGQERLEQKFTRGFKTIVKEQQKTKSRFDSTEQARKRQKLSDDDGGKKEIQQKLIDVYKSDCFTLPISPLFKDENQELLKIYQIPSLSVVDYNKTVKAVQKRVKSCKDIFYQGQQQCQNIYITGDAGVGKSSFCMYMSLIWSMAHIRNRISNDRMQEDADFLAKFDYLFYVRLRDTDRTDVKAMIVDQLFYTESQEKWNKIYEQVENILKCHKSLVILDGLDEWSPKSTGKQDFNIPYRPTWEKCTYITTCRPYKIENVRLGNKDLDQQVKMSGIHGISMKSYVAEIVKHINVKRRVNLIRTEEDSAKYMSKFLDIPTSNIIFYPSYTCNT